MDVIMTEDNRRRGIPVLNWNASLKVLEKPKYSIKKLVKIEVMEKPSLFTHHSLQIIQLKKRPVVR